MCPAEAIFSQFVYLMSCYQAKFQETSQINSHVMKQNAFNWKTLLKLKNNNTATLKEARKSAYTCTSNKQTARQTGDNGKN